MGTKSVLFKSLLAFVVLVVALVLVISIPPRLSLIGKTTDLKVYVAYGFHMNLYHSYRIDTNNEEGFGKDIRIVRKIIEVLDQKNKEGVPVKGVWDSENLFSLQEQLPKYAPDIISDIKRRVQENGDEVILMSYNNALSSALTPKEFNESISRSISNEHNSGVEDLFGQWSPYVRPQEMMTTPGIFDAYKELGIKGLALYYSSVTFDAFRSFARELTLEEAHNPINYVNLETGEKMTILPTYNHGDMIENVSIERWVRQLHREQLRGNIKNDVILFFNTDADAEYWYGFDVDPWLQWLPNVGGLEQSIESIQDLDYVEFTTMGQYLKDHAPVSDISFGQDTADGSFNGYVSWAEKAYSHDYWTAITKNRRLHRYANKLHDYIEKPFDESLETNLSESFEKRMRLQSTTNFGLATPFLARTRERVVESVIGEMEGIEEKIQKNLQANSSKLFKTKQLLLNTNQGTAALGSVLVLPDDKGIKEQEGIYLDLNVEASELSENGYYLTDKAGKEIPASIVFTSKKADSNIQTLKLFVSKKYSIKPGVYSLFQKQAAKLTEIAKTKTLANEKVLKNEYIHLNFSDSGMLEQVEANGKRYLNKGSFIPKIRYDGKLYQPDSFRIKVLQDGSNGVASLQLDADFTPPIPGVLPGSVRYQMTLVEGGANLMVNAKIQYPETPRLDVFKPNKPLLARKWDSKWQEVMPLELMFADQASEEKPFKVLKRNHFGVESHYLIDYFKHSKKNLNLSNINNHITAEYVGVVGNDRGLAVAMDTNLLSNFAFSPLKMKHADNRFSLSLNPFGTYFGEQYFQPTWGDQIGYDVSLVSADQYSSSAATFNGYQYEFSLMIAFFEGQDLPDQVKNDLITFAKPAFAVQQNAVSEQVVELPNIPPKGLLALSGKEGVYLHWEKPKGNPEKYKIYMGSNSGKYEAVYESIGNLTTHHAIEFQKVQGFIVNKPYYMAVSSIDKNGAESKKSKEIRFVPTGAPAKNQLAVPKKMQLRILGATLLSYFD